MNELDKSEKNIPDDFVFSTYFLALKNAWKGSIADCDLITMLYGFIADPLGLCNNKGDLITCLKDQASRIKNQTANANQKIRNYCKDSRIKESIVTDFEKMVVPKLQESKTDKLMSTLLESIKSSECSSDTKDELISLADAGDLAKFLSRSFQESLVWDNKVKQTVTPYCAPFSKHGGIKNTEVPEEIAEKEMPYVYALMQIYGETEKTDSFGPADLDEHSNHKTHFQRQRKDYYSAEFVRRCMRDSYADEADNQFETLENEVCDGVIDTYEADYSSGKKRLSEVLAQAARIPVDKCWASRDTDWIGNSEKKGVCHILVNDERIRGWLDEDR